MAKPTKFVMDFFRGRTVYAQAAAVGTVLTLLKLHIEDLHYRVESSTKSYLMSSLHVHLFIITAKKANITKIAKCNLEIYSDKPVNISTCTDVQMYR